MSHGHEHHRQETPELHDAPDAWHDHSRDEPPQPVHSEVANSGKIIVTGVLAWLVVVISTVVVYGYYTHFTTAKLAASERDQSMAPAMDALQYKRDSILNHTEGGKVFAQVVRGDQVSMEHVTQLPMFKPGAPEIVDGVKKQYGLVK